MRKTKKTKQSPRVGHASSKRSRQASAAQKVSADAPIAFNDPFPLTTPKTDLTGDTASVAPESHSEPNFHGVSKAA